MQRIVEQVRFRLLTGQLMRRYVDRRRGSGSLRSSFAAGTLSMKSFVASIDLRRLFSFGIVHAKLGLPPDGPGQGRSWQTQKAPEG
jgi:hypothetical protein